MAIQIVIVEQRSDWKPHYPDSIVVTGKDYITLHEYLKLKDVRILNFCRSYRYLSIGYYCSLLAEARKHKIIPTVRTITDLSSKSIYSLNIEDLDQLIQRSLKKSTENSTVGSFSIIIYFGHCDNKDLQEFSRQLFDLFRCPLLKVEFKLNGKWQVSAIKPGFIQNITREQETFFIQAFQSYSTKRWQTPKIKNVTRYDLAVLHNPVEKFPPSNKWALGKFVNIGKKLGLDVDLIEKKDYSRLAEYDALFIRETTEIDHHTYRFSRRAENEGMVVIDDPDSIVKCTNKIYLFELLSANKIPIPHTEILKKDDVNNVQALETKLSYPLVLKIPDSSFSRGIYKVKSSEELKKITFELFSESDVILAQEYLYTDFDWRIGILNKKPLFACQYFMSKHHWQIIKHTPSGYYREGDYKTWRIEDVPADVVKIASSAANLIGNGLYGVDLKQTEKGVFVMEINDNPNIDVGIEDKHLGDELYKMIIQEFIRRLDVKKSLY